MSWKVAPQTGNDVRLLIDTGQCSVDILLLEATFEYSLSRKMICLYVGESFWSDIMTFGLGKLHIKWIMCKTLVYPNLCE